MSTFTNKVYGDTPNHLPLVELDPRWEIAPNHTYNSGIREDMSITGVSYTVYGYKGKQVRDNIHSVDLIQAFFEFFKAPRVAEVHNTCGGRYSNCSMLEVIDICQKIVGRELKSIYSEQNRIGDHIWWVSDNSKFAKHYPNWKLKSDIPQILQEIYKFNKERWSREAL